MPDKFLNSSDAPRQARPLRHARTFEFRRPLALELGGSLPEVVVTYETYGRLNERKDNAILVCHPISGDSHAARHDENDEPGWWDIIVGPGKAIDTGRYFVICPNLLGGCRGTTGPNSVNPASGKPYGRDFPTITVGDMAEVQRLLVDELGIDQLLAVVGGSMGGHVALSWAERHGGRAKGFVPIATSPRLTSQALAFDVVGRNAILRDPNFHGGRYYERGAVPAVGLAVARMIGHITYLSPQAMHDKFEADRHRPRAVATAFEKKFSVGSYLGYQGDKFVERFDANSYITLSMAMDLFDLGRNRDELAAALAKTAARWLVVSFTSDWLFPPEQSLEIVQALVARGARVSYANVASTCGHDAFLLPNDSDRYGSLVGGFLANLSGAPVRPADEDSVRDATSIFHERRLDYDRLVDLIPAGASVLDLGCGSGGLLERLRQRGHDRVVGLELDEAEIVRCVARGLDVVHADLNRGLSCFGDGQFDFVVLSQTLQTIRDVPAVLGEVLRVGRQCIVSFPNFAYHKLRKMLCEQGRAPQASMGLLCYNWYETPNIRFFSIDDFRAFCRQKGFAIHKEEFLDTEAGAEAAGDPNSSADLAIFVIGK
jgi:homoserine O-acetyltransferase/O-succinyltransferase